MNAKEKIKLYLQEKGMNPNQFYRATGLSNGFLDQGKGIGSDKIKIIIEVFSDLNLYWLILDQGEMIIDTKKATNVSSEEQLQKLLQSKDKSIIKMAEEIGALKYENKLLKKQIGYCPLSFVAEPELKNPQK